MFTSPIFLIALLARLSASQNSTSSHNVDVGNDGLSFQPERITAKVGDKVMFKINGFHSVINGPYDQPCKPAAKDKLVFAGYPGINGGDDGVFTYVVTSTDPMFFYCPVDNHCQQGMSFTINQSQTQTHEGYKTKAKTAPITPAPPTTQAPSGGSAVIERDADDGSDTDHSSMSAVGYSLVPGPTSTVNGTVSATGAATATGTGKNASGGSAKNPTSEALGRSMENRFQLALFVSVAAVIVVLYAMT